MPDELTGLSEHPVDMNIGEIVHEMLWMPVQTSKSGVETPFSRANGSYPAGS